MSAEQTINFDDIIPQVKPINIKTATTIVDSNNVITNKSVDDLVSRGTLNNNNRLSDAKNIINDLLKSEIPKEDTVDDITPPLGIDTTNFNCGITLNLNTDILDSHEETETKMPVEESIIEEPKLEFSLILPEPEPELELEQENIIIEEPHVSMMTYKEVLSTIKLSSAELTLNDTNIALLITGSESTKQDVTPFELANVVNRLRESIIKTGLNYISIEKYDLKPILNLLDNANLEAFQLGIKSPVYYVRFKEVPMELEMYQSHIFNSLKDRIQACFRKNSLNNTFSHTINLTNNGIPLMTNSQLDELIKTFNNKSYNIVYKTIQSITVA